MVTENVGVAQLASEFGLCKYTLFRLIYRDRHFFLDLITSLAEYGAFFARTAIRQCQQLTGLFDFHIQYCTVIPLIDRLPIYLYHALPCLCLLMDSRRACQHPCHSNHALKVSQLVCGAGTLRVKGWEGRGKSE